MEKSIKGEKNMKKKLMRMPKVVTILVAILIVAIFLGSMDVAAFFLANTVSLPGYGNSMIAEFAAGVVAFLFLCLFGYVGILKEKGKGFINGLYIGGFLTGYCCLELAAQLYVQMMTPDTKVVSALEILFFAATMFLIGWTEELVFRGVILNLFLERFSKTKRGILWAVILSSVLFGAVHLTNISQGVTVTSAMIQAINGAFLGVIFGAVYARSRNIWLVITFHALVDFASLMGSGIFGVGTTVEQINQMSAVNLIAVPILLIPCIVLLRPKKLLEMEQEANHIVVFDTFEEADRNAALSLALGMISILTGFMGYGLGIGIAGLIGGRLSRKVQPEKNGMALVGMILSGIGMAVSIIGMIVLCFVYSNLNGLSAVMMMNGVK